MQLEQEVDSIAEATGFSGVVRVDRADGIELAKAYGLAHRGLEIPNTIDTQFAIASGAKGMTAVAVASLIDDGSLDLSTTARSGLGRDLQLIVDDVTGEHRSGISRSTAYRGPMCSTSRCVAAETVGSIPPLRTSDPSGAHSSRVGSCRRTGWPNWYRPAAMFRDNRCAMASASGSRNRAARCSWRAPMPGCRSGAGTTPCATSRTR